MPIKVSYGGGRGSDTAGQILAQAGIASQDRAAREAAQRMDLAQREGAQIRQLSQQRDMQMAQIDAAADRQRQAADDATARTAMQFGLDQQLQEQEFNRAMQVKQQEARLAAEQWEYKYSAKDRMDIARDNQALQQFINDPRNTQEQKDEVSRQMQLRNLSRGSSTPIDPNKPKPPPIQPGQEPGKVWEHPELGGGWTTDPITGIPELVIKPGEMPEAIKAKQQSEYRKQQLAGDVKREDGITGAVLEFAQTAITSGEGDNITSRLPSIPEIRSEERRVRGEHTQWYHHYEDRGIFVSDVAKRFPRDVGVAHTELVERSEKFSGTFVPDVSWPATQEVVRIYKQYAKSYAADVVREYGNDPPEEVVEVLRELSVVMAGSRDLKPKPGFEKRVQALKKAAEPRPKPKPEPPYIPRRRPYRPYGF